MADTTIKQELGRVADGLEALLENQRREREERQRREYDEYFAAHKGRRALRHPDLGFYLQAVPGAAALFKQVVPAEFWIENKGLAVVSCPCSETPEVPRDSLIECKCARVFIYTGTQVCVWREKEAESA